MVLSPVSARPLAFTPSTPDRNAVANVVESTSAFGPVAAIAETTSCISGPAAPPTEPINAVAALFAHRPEVCRHAVVESASDGLHTAVHVDAMVGITDGGIQIGEV